MQVDGPVILFSDKNINDVCTALQWNGYKLFLYIFISDYSLVYTFLSQCEFCGGFEQCVRGSCFMQVWCYAVRYFDAKR